MPGEQRKKNLQCHHAPRQPARKQPPDAEFSAIDHPEQSLGSFERSPEVLQRLDLAKDTRVLLVSGK